MPLRARFNTTAVYNGDGIFPAASRNRPLLVGIQDEGGWLLNWKDGTFHPLKDFCVGVAADQPAVKFEWNLGYDNIPVPTWDQIGAAAGTSWTLADPSQVFAPCSKRESADGALAQVWSISGEAEMRFSAGQILTAFFVRKDENLFALECIRDFAADGPVKFQADLRISNISPPSGA